ncbi:MAG: ACP S-malonyltransferase [Actinobacteria bacterium]|nr:ACP S-malonyltransferase [Actinomycetota bacterium]
MPIAVVFPGQGSQAPGFCLPWLTRPAWRVVTEAEEALGRRLSGLLTDAGADLSATADAQLSVLLGSLVAWRDVAEHLPEPPAFVAGHSLGQITALIAAGVLGAGDGVRFAGARAAATQAAADETPGRLLALLGADEPTATAACEAAPGAAWVANINAPGQVVLGGTPEGMDAAAERAGQLGVRRARPLAVGGAFHTPLMQPAADRLGADLERLATRDPAVPVVTNHDAAVCRSGEGWDERLAVHLVRAVRWQASVETMVAEGVDTFVEVGPGTTLTGLIKRIAPEATTANVAHPDDAARLSELLPSTLEGAR